MTTIRDSFWRTMVPHSSSIYLMEPLQPPSSSPIDDPHDIKLIQWDDFDRELTRVLSLSSALHQAQHKKQFLQIKLHSLTQDETESLNRSNQLEQIRQKLEARKLIMENLSRDTKLAAEDAKTQEESLSTKVRSLLVAGAALSVSKKRLQDSNKLISGQKGYIRLANLQRMVRKRQQHMISQVSLLYQVKVSVGPPPDQELKSFPSISRSGNSTGPVHHGSLTILGLHLTTLPYKIMSFFTDTKKVQSFAAALGYVAHAVSLIAYYLNVPLRYPLRLCGSHSYINDYAQSMESTSSETPPTSLLDSIVKHVELPLFLEGQDTTRAAYALFLLNKDLEQLLNFIGTISLGPPHLLANLKEVLRIIQSADFVRA